MIILYLTCANTDEANRISKALLEDRLIACARSSAVTSSYWWNGKINQDSEILLMMETVEAKFDAVNSIVKQLHSYDEYVLTAIPVLRTTPGVERWLSDTLS